MNPPDLDNPAWVLLLLALGAWLLLGGMTVLERRRARLACDRAQRRHDGRADHEPEDDDTRDRAEGDPQDGEALRGSVTNVHAPIVLDDDEVLALARYLELSSRRMSGMQIADAYDGIVKVTRAASDIIHADRASRRRG